MPLPQPLFPMSLGIERDKEEALAVDYNMDASHRLCDGCENLVFGLSSLVFGFWDLDLARDSQRKGLKPKIEDHFFQ